MGEAHPPWIHHDEDSSIMLEFQKFNVESEVCGPHLIMPEVNVHVILISQPSLPYPSLFLTNQTSLALPNSKHL